MPCYNARCIFIPLSGLTNVAYTLAKSTHKSHKSRASRQQVCLRRLIWAYRHGNGTRHVGIGHTRMIGSTSPRCSPDTKPMLLRHRANVCPLFAAIHSTRDAQPFAPRRRADTSGGVSCAWGGGGADASAAAVDDRHRPGRLNVLQLPPTTTCLVAARS